MRIYTINHKRRELRETRLERSLRKVMVETEPKRAPNPSNAKLFALSSMDFFFLLFLSCVFFV